MSDTFVAKHSGAREGSIKLLFDLAPLLLVTILLLLCLWLYEPRVISTGNLYNVLRNMSFLAVVGIGQMLVMKSGGFDMSVGGVAALSSVVAATVMTATSTSMLVAVALGVGAGLATGLIVGATNGIAVTAFRAPPFMVTLGMLSIATGVAMYLTSGIPIYGLPEPFARTFARGSVLGVSNLIWVCVLAVGLVGLLVTLTPFGRHLRAVGGNSEAARLSGVKVKIVTVTAYMISSLMAAIVGLLLTARLGSGQFTAGLDLMLQSIAVAVIGGVALRGGHGRLERVILAAAFLAIVANGMNLIRLDSRYQPIVIGLIIIVASIAERFTVHGGSLDK